MILLTDNISFAQQCMPHSDHWQACRVSALSPPLAMLAGELFSSNSLMQTELAAGKHWDYLLAVDCARKSQYDVLSRLVNSGCELPDRILCCAGSGDRFHGFKNRSWKASRGNIHLSAFIKPEREIPGAAVGFIIAAVAAALRTVDSFELQGALPTVKWVNDILIQGAKVGGVLARLQTQARVTHSAVVGIGLNVEQKPTVHRDPFVPEVAALSDFVASDESCFHADAFPRLMGFLGESLESLCKGGFDGLLDFYRQRSLVLGQPVTICEDTRDPSSRVIARGLVESIGPALELYIKGHTKPITNGRLRLAKTA